MRLVRILLSLVMVPVFSSGLGCSKSRQQTPATEQRGSDQTQQEVKQEDINKGVEELIGKNPDQNANLPAVPPSGDGKADDAIADRNGDTKNPPLTPGSDESKTEAAKTPGSESKAKESKPSSCISANFIDGCDDAVNPFASSATLSTVRSYLEALVDKDSKFHNMALGARAVGNTALTAVGVYRHLFYESLRSELLPQPDGFLEKVFNGKLGSVTVMGYVHDGKEPRPLMVYLTGTSSNSDHYFVLNMVREIRHRGYNVLVLPNPFSPQYIAALRGHVTPENAPGNIEFEARVMLDLITTGVQKFKDHGVPVTSVNLIGTSYGANLLALTKLIDQEQNGADQIIDGQLTLLSPTFDFQNSPVALDRLLDGDAYKKFKALPYVKRFALGRMVYNAKTEDELNELLKDESITAHELGDALYATFFNKALVKAAIAILDPSTEDTDNLIDPLDIMDLPAPNFDKWLKEINIERKDLHFKDFIAKFHQAPAADARSVELGSILSKLSNVTYRVVTSRDDFVHGIHPSESLTAATSDQNVFHKDNFTVIERGGSGYLRSRSNVFQNLMDDLIGPRQE